MRVPKSKDTQDVTIKRVLPGYYDDHQRRVEPGEVLIATVTNCDIQPLTGQEIITAIKNGYDSDHQAFIGLDNITFETSYSDIRSGDKLYDASLQPFKIVFPGYFRNSHYEPLLKLRG